MSTLNAQPRDTSGQGTSLGNVFFFWAPLAATWLMMSVEGPLLAALISRLPEPKFNLAAYGVAFSFALVIEAPIIMMMSASTALVTDRLSYLRLRNFAFAFCGGVTLIQVVLLLPPVFNQVIGEWVGLPPNVTALTNTALMILLPWPGVIGYRRFYQGILIRADQTRRVAYGTIVRLSFMGLTAAILFWNGALPGAWVAAAALTCGVVAEAAASRVMAAPQLEELDWPASDAAVPGYRQIWEFYYPLALTSILSVGVHPLITFMIGRSRMGLESLAVLPVVNSLVFIFRSLGLAYQEVGIALIGSRWEGYRTLRLFALLLAAFVTGALAVIAFSPLEEIWFVWISGLPRDLAGLAGSTLRLLIPLPGLAILLCFQRAMLVNLRVTRWITLATVLEVIALSLVLIVCLRGLDAVGAFAAAAAMVSGRLLATLFLLGPLRRRMRPMTVSGTSP